MNNSKSHVKGMTACRVPEVAKGTNVPSTELISRQAAIDAVCMEWCGVKHQDCKHQFDVKKDDYYWCDGCETALRTLPDLPSIQPETCDTCKHGYFGDERCNDCRVRFTSHYERRTDGFR